MRTIIITAITLNKNHPVEDGASVETDATSDGDKIDNSLLDLKVIASSVSGPFVAFGSSGILLSSRLLKKLKNEDFSSSFSSFLSCSSPPFNILSDLFKELDLDFGFNFIFDLGFSFIVLKYNYKIFNLIDFLFINIFIYSYFYLLIFLFIYSTILNNTSNL